MTKYEMIKKKQLKEFVKDYYKLFKGWILIDSITFARYNTLVEQMVWFDRLSGGRYRPTLTISTCLDPVSGLFHQHLKGKCHTISPLEHPLKYSNALDAMEEQFLPSIKQSLVLKEVLTLSEDSFNKQSNMAVGLAVLNAYVGNNNRAIELCESVPCLVEKMGRPPADWEIEQIEFSKKLIEETGKGFAKQFIDIKVQDWKDKNKLKKPKQL